MGSVGPQWPPAHRYLVVGGSANPFSSPQHLEPAQSGGLWAQRHRPATGPGAWLARLPQGKEGTGGQWEGEPRGSITPALLSTGP